MLERWLASERNARICLALGSLTIAFSSILVRLSGASPSTATIFRCLYALPLLGLLTWLEDRRLGSRSWRERSSVIAAGVFLAVDLLVWNHSIVDVGAGLATVLANVQVVILPLVAWVVLSERPGRAVLAALPIAFVGVLLISGVFDRHAYGRHPERGAIFGVCAGIAYVGFILLLRHGGSDLRRLAGPLFDATATAAIVAIAAGLVIGDARLVPSWPSAGWLATLALTSQVVGWLLIGVSLPRLQAATASLLLMLSPIGAMILAAVIFTESPSSLQLAGVLFILGALIVATRSSRAPQITS